MLRTFLIALCKRVRPREGWLETWWERVLAGVAALLLLALVINIAFDGC
jgi:hypothetical protein